MIGYSQTTHGNFICDFCEKRRMYKSRNGIVTHLESEHPKELELARANAKIAEVKRDADAKVRRAQTEITLLRGQLEETKELLKKPATPKKEYYDAIWYCGNCLKVFEGGLPKGTQLINVCCGGCGITGRIQLVTNVSRFFTK